MDDPDVFANVADWDQHHAEAVDYLREAQTFLLAVPREDPDSGEWRIVCTGGGVDFVSFRTAVAASLNAAVWDDVVRAMERTRYLRLFMLAAALANVILFAVNLSLALAR